MSGPDDQQQEPASGVEGVKTLVDAGVFDDQTAADASARLERDGATWPGVLTEMGLDSGTVHTALSILGDGGTAPAGGAWPEPEVEIPTEAPHRYEVFEELGRGGMGRVERAHDAVLHRSIARKALLVPHPGIRARFLREARITAQLEHPGIVPVYELGRAADGTLFYTMKEVRGRTLRDALDATETIDERLELLAVLVDVCQAIGYAHSKGVVHRDLKPENVMIGAFGETTVLDWGLAKAHGEPDVDDLSADLADLADVDLDAFVERAPAASTARTGRTGRSSSGGSGGAGLSGSGSLTRAGTVLGTPKYMSPEQARGDADLDARSDVWSLGIILYELLTGDVPFDGPSESVLRQVQDGVWVPVEDLQRDCPPALATLCHKALSRDPDDRYPTADALGVELESWRTGGRVDAHTYTAMDKVRRAGSRFRLGLVGVLGLAAGLVGGAFWVGQQRDTARAETRASEQAREMLSALAEALTDEATGRSPEALARVREVLAHAHLDAVSEQRAQALLERVRRSGDVRVLATGAVDALAWAPSGGRLAWIGSDSTLGAMTEGVVLADPDSGGRLGVVPSPDGTPITAFAFSPDENRVWVGTQGGTLAGMKGVDLSVAKRIELDGPIEDVVITERGTGDAAETRITAGRSGVWRQFSPDGTEHTLPRAVATASKLFGAHAPTLSIDVSSNTAGNRTYTAGDDGVVEVVEHRGPDSEQPGEVVLAHLETGRRLTHLTMEPDGTDLALAGPDGVMLWSVVPHDTVESNLRVCPGSEAGVGAVVPVLPFPRTDDLEPPKRACP